MMKVANKPLLCSSLLWQQRVACRQGIIWNAQFRFRRGEKKVTDFIFDHPLRRPRPEDRVFDRVCPRNALDSTSTDQGLGTGPLVGRVGLATDKSRCCYGQARAGSGSCASPV
ncbi:hypothetical protein HYQ44_007646 [Verticillium longisporum]|nr:hypothetical protein HYQ44_007646 [Verticillium longisporum]